MSVDHYDRVLLACGKPYWVLQPRRDGPYVLKPHPGQNLTRAEMLERESKNEVEKVLPL